MPPWVPWLDPVFVVRTFMHNNDTSAERKEQRTISKYIRSIQFGLILNNCDTADSRSRVGGWKSRDKWNLERIKSGNPGVASIENSLLDLLL